MKKIALSLLLLALALPAPGPAKTREAPAEAPEADAHLASGTLSALALRNIGPAINSGRVVHFAVTPGKRQRFFVATASGNLWKTDNAGTTWTPVFDGEGSYSIGA